MGFRCPKCNKDFGNNQFEFYKHLTEERVDIVNHVKNRLKEDKIMIKKVKMQIINI